MGLGSGRDLKFKIHSLLPNPGAATHKCASTQGSHQACVSMGGDGEMGQGPGSALTQGPGQERVREKGFGEIGLEGC